MLRLRACRWQTPRFLWRRGGSKGYLRVRRRHTLHPARPHLFFAWRRGYQFGTHPTHLHKNSTVKSPTFEHTCSSRRKTSAPASSGESVGWLSPAPAQRGPAASICAQSHVDLSVSFRNLCLGFKSLVSRSILESTLRTQCAKPKVATLARMAASRRHVVRSRAGEAAEHLCLPVGQW